MSLWNFIWNFNIGGKRNSVSVAEIKEAVEKVLSTYWLDTLEKPLSVRAEVKNTLRLHCSTETPSLLAVTAETANKGLIALERFMDHNKN